MSVTIEARSAPLGTGTSEPIGLGLVQRSGERRLQVRRAVDHDQLPGQPEQVRRRERHARVAGLEIEVRGQRGPCQFDGRGRTGPEQVQGHRAIRGGVDADALRRRGRGDRRREDLVGIGQGGGRRPGLAGAEGDARGDGQGGEGGQSSVWNAGHGDPRRESGCGGVGGTRPDRLPVTARCVKRSRRAARGRSVTPVGSWEATRMAGASRPTSASAAAERRPRPRPRCPRPSGPRGCRSPGRSR